MAQIHLDNYVNLNKKSYIRPGYRVEYSDERIPEIEIRDAKKGTRFYMEPAHGTSPVMKQSALPSGPAWSYSMTELHDIRRERNGGNRPAKKMGFFESLVMSFASTADAHAVGISPDYLTATALGDGAGMVVSNGLEGKIFCLQCGALLTQTPGRKRVKFCSDNCRTAWWNAHPEKVNRRAVYHFTCAHCGKPFTAYGNAKRKYCSHACYIADRYKGGDGHE